MSLSNRGNSSPEAGTYSAIEELAKGKWQGMER